MIGMSLYSALTLSNRYFGLMAVYVLIFLIRTPSFIYNRHLVKSNLEPAKQFQRKHFVMLFAGLMLIAYFILSFVVNYTQSSEPQTKPVFLVYAYVVPWAVIRTGIEIYRLTTIKHNHDPYYRTKIIVDFISVALTVLCALTDVIYINQQNTILMVIFLVIIILLLLYWVGFALHMLITSIRGLTHHRKKQEALFIDEITLQ